MARISFDQRPDINEDVLKAWPRPPDVPRYRWDRWSLRQRQDYLLDRTFDEQDGRWVAKDQPADPQLADQVIQAATTTAGLGTFSEELLGAINDHSPSKSDPHGSNFATAIALLFVAILAVVITLLILDLFGSDGDDQALTDPSTTVTTVADAPTSSVAPDSVAANAETTTTTTEAVTTTEVATTVTTTVPTERRWFLGVETGPNLLDGTVTEHVAQMLVNMSAVNLTQEALDRGLVASWTSTYRDAAQHSGGLADLFEDSRRIEFLIEERWTCEDDCLTYSDYYDLSWDAVGSGQLTPDGDGWAISGTATVSYRAARGASEQPSMCGGTECWNCADRYCRWDSAATATVPFQGRIDGTDAWIAFSDGLEADISGMDFEPLRQTEFFMSRLVHRWALAEPYPSP